MKRRKGDQEREKRKWEKRGRANIQIRGTKVS